MAIGQKHWYGVVLANDVEQEFDVARRIEVAFEADACDFHCSVGPNLHTFALLLGEVFDEVVGDVQKHTDHHYCDNQECNFAVAAYVVDVHAHTGR